MSFLPRPFLLRLLLICSPIALLGQTSVTSNIDDNTNWTLSGSPYIIENTITINQEAILTIQPGVVVKFLKNSASRMAVRGGVSAIGTPQQPIVFTSYQDDSYGGDTNGDGSASIPTAQDWRSISIESSSGTNTIFSNCIFRYGGHYFSPEGVIRVINSQPNISNCQFQFNAQALYIAQSSSPTVTNCNFENHTSAPIALALGAEVDFSDLSFQNNGLNALQIISGSYTANTNYVLAPIDESIFPFQSYVLEGEITIGEQATLTIEPGVIIKHDDAVWRNMINVNGFFSAKGTSAQPITFTDIKDDAIGGDTNNDGDASAPVTGDWGGILLNSTGELENCQFRFGGKVLSNVYDGVLEIRGGSTLLKDNTFKYCEVGVTISGGATPRLEGNKFEECTSVPISLSLSASPTFSQNQFLDNRRNGVGLLAFNYNTSGADYSLQPISIDDNSVAPYIIYDDGLIIGEQVSLTLLPGVVIKHDASTWMNMMEIKGTLLAKGTLVQPIIFTDIKDDAIGGDANNDGDASAPVAGDWGGILLTNSVNSMVELENCQFRFGGKVLSNVYDGTLEIRAGSTQLKNNEFIQCEVGVTISGGATPNLEGNKFEECTSIPIALSLNANPSFNQNQFVNNRRNGVGLLAFNYNTSGATYTLNPVSIDGNTPAPYIIYDNGFIIDEGVSLTIQPGVIIKHDFFRFYDLMTIRGQLIAQGTVSQPIIFTTISDDEYGGDTNNDGAETIPAAESWKGILLETTSGNSTSISNCYFRFGGYSQNGGDAALEINGSDPVVADNIFFNGGRGMTIRQGGQPIINNNTFDRNSVIPIAISLSASPSFTGNKFESNAINAIGVIGGNYAGPASYNLKQIDNTGGTEAPYYLEETLTLEEGVHLNIEAGTVIKVEGRQNGSDIFIRVNGSLTASGTETAPIIFTSSRDDSVFGDTNNDGSDSSPALGDWFGIRFTDTSGESGQLSHCQFNYGGYYSIGGTTLYGVVRAEGTSKPTISNGDFLLNSRGVVAADASQPTIQNCRFERSGWTPISVSLAAKPVFTGITFFNNGKNAVGIEDGEYESGDLTLEKISLAGIDNLPYYVQQNISLGEAVTLTIEPGVIIKFRSASDNNFDNVRISVEGAIRAEGSIDEPIIFTSELDDEIGGDTNNDGGNTAPGFGDWYGFLIQSTSEDRSRFSYCNFRHGGYYARGSAFAYGVIRSQGKSSPVIENCTFFETSKAIIAADESTPQILNNTFGRMGWLAVGIDLGADPTLVGNSIDARLSIAALGIESKDYEEEGTYQLKKRSFAGIENAPYFFQNGLVFSEAINLVIQAGIVMKFYSPDNNANNITLINRGTLIAEGTQAEPIVFTSWRDDEFGGDANYSSATSATNQDWMGLVMQGEGSNNSRLSHCQFRFGGFRDAFPDIFGALRLEESSPTIEKCTFEHNKKGLVTIEGSDIAIDSCDFKNNEIGLSKEGGRVVINRSNIVDNSVYGVENLTTEDVDATSNWWGQASGPFHPEKNPSGQGNEVTDYVLFEPYLERKVAFEKDIGITALIRPQTGCELGQEAIIEVAITNYGNAPQTGFDIEVVIDEEVSLRENVGSLVIPVDSTINYTLSTTANLSIQGPYFIATYTLLDGDQNITNDRFETFVNNYSAIPVNANFNNLLPMNGDSSIQRPVQFSWSSIENADVYDLYVWFAALPEPSEPIVAAIDQITYQLNSNFLPGVSYHWKVVARNPCSTLSSPIQTFTIQSLPDLVVNNVQVPSEPFSGQEIEISWETINQGTNNTGDTRWFDGIYLSQDPILDVALDTYLGAVFNDIALESEEGYTQTATVRLPQGIQNTWYIFIVADYLEFLQEPDNSNNSSYTAIEVNLTPPPDLQVSNIIAPNNAFSEEFIAINWSVTNEGTGATLENFWRDAIYLSEQEELDKNNSFLLGRFDHSGILEASAFYERTETVALPPGIFGTYYIHIETDEGDRAFEFAFENNNISRSDSMTIFLTPPPDLVPLSINSPAQASNRELVNIRWTAANQGASNITEGYFDRLYLSPNPTFDVDQSTLVGNLFINGPVNIGREYTAQRTIAIPDKISGRQYIYLVTDGFDDIFEFTQESNNILRGDQINIVQPDLAVTEVRTQAEAEAGGDLMVNWTVTNLGQGDLSYIGRTDSIFIANQVEFDRANATLLGTHTYNSQLRAGQRTIRQLTVPLPNGLSGPYYIFVSTNTDEGIFENGQLTNNIGSTSLAINFPPWPDLEPTTVVGVPASLIAGNRINMTYTVKNGGQGELVGQAWTDRLYISASPVWIPGAAKELEEYTIISSLQPDGTYQKTTSFILPMLPGGAGVGVCFLYIFADADNQVFEHTDENNNVLRSIPIDVTAPPPTDLALLAAVSAVDTTQSGTSLQVNWSVKNIGSSTAVWDYPFWYDGIYLSTDTNWDAGDIFITDWTHPAPLDSNAVYMDSRNFVVPPGLEGNYYFLMVTDHTNLVEDGDQRNNFLSITGDQPAYIRKTLYPDLQAQAFDAPIQGTAGQPIKLRWTVANNGQGPTLGGTWTDKVYLSTDFHIDGGDPILVTANRSQRLDIAQTYTDSFEVFLPTSASGNYILLFKTDANKNEYENQLESNNLASSNLNVLVPPPSDLIVAGVDFPEMAVVGEPLTVEWGVQNIGTNPASGIRTDFVYLSKDATWDISDIELGNVALNLNQAPGVRRTASLTMDVPGVPLGEYFVIIRTDGLNNIIEDNETNNIGLSISQISIDVPELTIAEPAETILRNGKNKYYKIVIPDSLAGETLLVNLFGDTLNANNELYLSYEDVPSRTNHQLSATAPFAGNQTIVIPSLEAGVYYLLAYGVNTATTTQDVSLLAEILEFEIRSVIANQGGNTGSMTVRLDGAKFTAGMNVKLDHPDRGTIEARNLYYTNSTRVYVTFDLTGRDEGFYDLIAEKENSEQTQLKDGFEITTGAVTSGSAFGDSNNGFVCYIENIGAEELLEVSVQHPPNTRLNRIVAMTIQYANNSNIDIPTPTSFFISLAGAPLGFSVEELSEGREELILEFKEDSGPPGILRPGASGAITVFTKAVAPMRFSLIYE